MGGKSDRKARRQRRAAPARLKRRGRPGTAGLRSAATGLEGSDAHTACRSRLTPSRARCPHGDWRGRSPASCDRSALGRRDGAQRRLGGAKRNRARPVRNARGRPPSVHEDKPCHGDLAASCCKGGFQSIPCWQKALCVKVRRARTCHYPRRRLTPLGATTE